ncbi:MAG: chemotaxis protein CheW [Phycisphaeraceae bacterium JB051]
MSIEQHHQDRSSPESQQLQLVTFGVGSEEFAIDILQVQEINRMMNLTRVPQSPASVKGVINLRGRIVPVVNLRQCFDMDMVEHDQSSRIVVVDVEGQIMGFLVDRVHEVLRIDSDIVEFGTDLLKTTQKQSYVKGIGKLEDRLLILLDLSRLIDTDDMQKIRQFSEQQQVTAQAA